MRCVLRSSGWKPRTLWRSTVSRSRATSQATDGGERTGLPQGSAALALRAAALAESLDDSGRGRLRDRLHVGPVRR